MLAIVSMLTADAPSGEGVKPAVGQKRRGQRRETFMSACETCAVQPVVGSGVLDVSTCTATSSLTACLDAPPPPPLLEQPHYEAAGSSNPPATSYLSTSFMAAGHRFNSTATGATGGPAG